MTPVRLDGTRDDVSTIAATGALSALVGLLLVSAVAAWWVSDRPRRIERETLAWFAGFASLAIIVAVTVFRDGFPVVVRLDGALHWSRDGLELVSRDPLGSSQFVLNFVLFIPAGLAWALILRRPLATLLGLSGVSVLVEVIQGVTSTGAPDAADVVANTIGSIVGVTAAAVLSQLTSTSRGRSTSRSRSFAIGALVVVIVIVLPAWFLGASRRQQAVEDTLRVAFEGTNRPVIESLTESDPEAVFGAATDWADGTRRSAEVLEIRFPAPFFGLHRCVFVVWDAIGVDFRKASGRDCTVFLTGEF